MAINHYRLLGVPPDADLKRIRLAYRSLAKRFHPDANKGSETATELFRQINEAYQVLTDPQRRATYDRKVGARSQAETGEQTPASGQTRADDPQQKFNRFLNSLLDAIFATPEPPPGKHTAQDRAPPRERTDAKVRRRPDFSFYYFLEMEKGPADYRCDDDGIYRRTGKKRTPEPGSGAGRYRTVPGSRVLILLVAGLLSLLQRQL